MPCPHDYELSEHCPTCSAERDKDYYESEVAALKAEVAQLKAAAIGYIEGRIRGWHDDGLTYAAEAGEDLLKGLREVLGES